MGGCGFFFEVLDELCESPLVATHIFKDAVVVSQVLYLLVLEHQIEQHVLVLDTPILLYKSPKFFYVVWIPADYFVYVEFA